MIIHLFEPLLNFDKDNNIIGGMAETWEVSEDGLTYTFHLREGLKWSDGTPLTANDFVYTFKRVADPLTAAPIVGFAGGCRSPPPSALSAGGPEWCRTKP